VLWEIKWKIFACSAITVTKVPEIINRAVAFMQKLAKTTVKAVSLIVIKYSEEFAVTMSGELHRLGTYWFPFHLRNWFDITWPLVIDHWPSSSQIKIESFRVKKSLPSRDDSEQLIPDLLQVIDM
jgi:hypothetical protein